LSRGRAAQKPKFSRRKWLRWIGLGILFALALPVLQVICVRFIDPPVTPLMFLRRLESRTTPAPPRQYAWAPIHAIPQPFLLHVLVAEDQRFFEHRGFDWKEIHKARQQAEGSGKAARGASTISMQCARSLFLWQGRSWVRKGLETYYTFWMETLLSKRRILELYANVIEMGDGIYGVKAAARAHYGQSLEDLTRDRCVMLVAILPNPRKWNPARPDDHLLMRHARILRRGTEAAPLTVKLRALLSRRGS
jgi:monofunctional biosynthetic peptidoglycan transglycosylase